MFLRKGVRYVWMAEAGDGSGGGGGASGGAASGAAGDGGAAAGAGAAASGDGSAGAGAGSALSQGAGQGGQQDQNFIPEKLQVKKEDGTLDLEASAKKVAEAYGQLEKRVGSGEVPPKTADEYKITVPEELKDVWKPEEDPLLKGFLGSAHAKGLTQGQVDFVMGEYFKLAPALVAGSNQLSVDDCTKELQKDWPQPEQYKAEVGKAYKAAVAYAGSDAEALVKEYGNDPRFVRMMNKIGAEMGEDKSLNTGGALPSGTSVESLMASEAYNNAKHADHAKVSKQVSDYFAAQAKKSPAAVM